MALTKINGPVNHDGKVTTIADLDAQGLIEYKAVRMGYNKNLSYFADIRGTSSGWQITKTAYLSRTGQNVKEAFN